MNVGIIICGILVIEVILFFLLHYLRKDYQWLILKKDEKPYFEQKSLDKFIKHGYDPILGWVRKPLTSGREQGRYGETRYLIDKKGSRDNADHCDLPIVISCYGDSFTFCRQVNDNETWAYYLSQLTNTNVLNFGVGNYGLDQALIRLKREFPSNSTKIVIMAVVPETISRILNVWKHYHEYGNIFGFKPRFIKQDKELLYIKNVIDNESQFFDLDKNLPHLQKYDYFYKKKFKKDILKFPFIYSLLRSAPRNIPLMARLLLEKIYLMMNLKEWYRTHIHNVSVLRRNIDICANLYQQEFAVDLMFSLVEDFKQYVGQRGGVPIFVCLPQLNDIMYMRKTQRCYYEPLINRIKSNCMTIDFTREFLDSANVEQIYSNDCYGGHLSSSGNRFVADFIYKVINSNNFLS